MKNVFFTLIFLLFIFCKKETPIESDHLLNHIMLKEDLFESTDLNEISFILRNDTVLVGAEGTKFIIEKDLFENYLGGNIVFEYKEFYKKEEIIKQGLTTTTDNDELLQTSGMFFINFKEKENQLIAKKGKFLKVQTTNEVKPNSQIFNIINDQKFEWSLSEKNEIYTSIIDVVKNYQYGILSFKDGTGGYFKDVKISEVEQVRKIDSIKLEELKSLNRSNRYFLNKDITNKGNKELKEIFELSNEVCEFYVSKFGWINIDEILESVIENEVTLKIKDHKIDYLSFFVLYFDYNSNYNSILTNLNEDKAFKFKQIGKGKVLFIYKEDDKILFDKFYFGNENSKSFSLNLKQVSLQQLRKEMITK